MSRPSVNMQQEMNNRVPVLSLMINTLSFEESLVTTMNWALNGNSAYVCFANVHMVIEAQNDPVFQKQVNDADLVLPDGKPIVHAVQWIHKKTLERVAGMDFLPRILEEANKLQGHVFIYGSSNEIQEAMIGRIIREFPFIKLAGRIVPPFRKLDENEINEHISTINASGAQLVLVSLGCPKQEKWMAENSAHIHAVLFGLGGAVDVFAGMRKRAPLWMQRNSLEWLFRLSQEPRRMFKRYFYTNTFFILLLIKKLIRR